MHGFADDMNFFRGSCTDENGHWDVAYVSLFGVGTAVICAIPFMCLMALASWLRCSCTFDPQPLGVAIGATCGGFATAVGGLAAYMAATRPPKA